MTPGAADPVGFDPLDAAVAGALMRVAFRPPPPQEVASVFSPLWGLDLAEIVSAHRSLQRPELIVSTVSVAADGLVGRLQAIGTEDDLSIGTLDETGFAVTATTSLAELAGRVAEQATGEWLLSASEWGTPALVAFSAVWVDGNRVTAGSSLFIEPDGGGPAATAEQLRSAVVALTDTLLEEARAARHLAAPSPLNIATDEAAESLLEGDDGERLAGIQQASSHALVFTEPDRATTIVSGPGGTLVLATTEAAETIRPSERGLLGEFGDLLLAARERALERGDAGVDVGVQLTGQNATQGMLLYEPTVALLPGEVRLFGDEPVPTAGAESPEGDDGGPVAFESVSDAAFVGRVAYALAELFQRS